MTIQEEASQAARVVVSMEADLADAKARRDSYVLPLREAKVSHREIGRLLGLSHTGIVKIEQREKREAARGRNDGD